MRQVWFGVDTGIRLPPQRVVASRCPRKERAMTQRRDEDALDTQSDVERLAAARSGLAVAVAAGLLVIWVVLRWIRHH